MRTFLATIFIISVTIKAGHCVVCTECNDSNATNCAGEVVTCGTCMTVVTEMNSDDGNGISYSVEKTCNLNSTICNTTYSINSDQLQARFTVHCCETDFCNQNATEVTPWNNTKNGLECPTCYTVDGETCEANSTVQCTGDETKCLVFSGKAPGKGTCQTVAFQGCVTECACNNSGHLHPDHAQCMKGTTSCSDSTNATYVP